MYFASNRAGNGLVEMNTTDSPICTAVLIASEAQLTNLTAQRCSYSELAGRPFRRPENIGASAPKDLRITKTSRGKRFQVTTASYWKWLVTIPGDGNAMETAGTT